MIPVGSRDERKELGLGLGSGGKRKMEENELEEGEACLNQGNDAIIDPDVAYSYLDDRIEDALGHCQKDFEGGVSADKLGAKFGGYGSFLPTHERSPSILSHPRTPQKVQNYDRPTSPKNLPVEGSGRTVLSSATPSAKVGPASSRVPVMPVSRAQSVENPSKRDASLSSAGFREITPKQEPINKLINSTNHKPLKVRIKVGHDNMAKTNAAIYSGLGLDISPSSSPEESPSESGGLSPESPYSILQVMTSFPVVGDFPISPLSDSLLQFMEKGKLLEDSRLDLVWNSNQESSVRLVNEPQKLKRVDKVFEEEKMKPANRNGKSMKMKNRNNKDALKKEVDIETPGCKDGVSNSSKLATLSNSKGIGEIAAGTRKAHDEMGETNKSILKDKLFSLDFMKEDGLDSMGRQDVSNLMNCEADKSIDKVRKEQKSSSLKDAQLVSEKEARKKFQKSNDLFQAQFDSSKGEIDGGPTDRVKEKVNDKTKSFEQDTTKLNSKKEEISSRGKKKVKVSLSNGAPCSSSTSRDRKKADGDYLSETKLDDNRLQKDTGQTREARRVSSADIQVEHGKNMAETPLRDRPREARFELTSEKTSFIADKLDERSSGKKVDKPLVDKPLVSQAYPNGNAVLGSHSTANVPASDSVPPAAASQVIDEDWVCCDRCQKWRLLPYGTNPDQLPSDWLCSMLSWLPGLNKCSVSEEETTKALRALYQIPYSEGQHNKLSQPSIVSSGATLVEPHKIDQTHQDHSLHPTGNVRNVAGVDHLNKPGNSGGEKQRQRLKEKNPVLQDGGDSNSKYSKTKSKRKTEADGNKSSKKIKTDGVSCSYENMESDHSGIIRGIGSNSNNGLSAQLIGKNEQKHDKNSFSKKLMNDVKDKIPVSVKKAKDLVQDSLDGGAIDVTKSGKADISGKKRKMKEWQANQIYPSDMLVITGNNLQDCKALAKEATSESEHRKEKKARQHKSDGKESKTSNDGDRTEPKKTQVNISGSRGPEVGGREEECRGITGQQLDYQDGKSVSQRTLDRLGSFKRDSGYVQPSATATSSSSKVSGSHKHRGNFQDVKGSPVESVSSSPLRISNPDRVTSARRTLIEKEDAANVKWLGTSRKEKEPSVVHCDLPEVLDYQDRNGDHMTVGKAKGHTQPSLHELDNRVNGGTHTKDQQNRYPGEPQAKDNVHVEERVNNNHSHSYGSLPKNSTKVSSSRSKEKQKGLQSRPDKGKDKVSSSFNEQELHPGNNIRDEGIELQEHTPYLGGSRDEKSNLQDKCGVKSGKYEISDKNSHPRSREGRKDIQSKLGDRGGSDGKSGATRLKDGRSNRPQNLPEDHEAGKSSNRFLSEKTEQKETALGRGESQLLPNSGDTQETVAQGRQQLPGTSTAAEDGGEASKITKQPRRPDNQNHISHNKLRNSTNSGLVTGLDAPSPARKDSFAQSAAIALKEAKGLKHSADRLKNCGSVLETTGLYFRAALKFLHGASLLEACSNESTRHGEVAQSMEVYSSTAKLCEFVAYEYERCKEMAAAALAYKCVEVAYMRVVYFKHSSASKDRHELQTALKMAPPGESPSSSASDIDNLNQNSLDKPALAANTLPVAGKHVIAAKNRPNFLRLLNFAEDVNFAMEASRKSQNAFAAANVSMGDAKNEEGICSIKKALDFSFSDVQVLLRLVRLAMEAISR